MRIAQLLLAALVVAAVFVVHARWIYTHFSSDGYLLDSGWLAYLFASRDPLLRDPSAINNLSFYAHHLSPHIFIFGAPLSLLFSVSGVTIFALHQGVFFSLFFLSLYLIVCSSRVPSRARIAGLFSAIVIGTLSNALLQAAAYPHYEIALIAIASLAIAADLADYSRLFWACVLWMPLIREDGGLYVAFTALACIAVDCDRPFRLHSRTLRLLSVAILGVGASACAFFVKAHFFPGFDALSSNFSGHSWDHVSARLVITRLSAMVRNLTVMPVVVGSLLLALLDIRYAVGLGLLSPLYALHLLSVRDELGHFTLYYALPWLLPCTLWIAVFVRRSASLDVSRLESSLVMLLALSLAAPVYSVLGLEGQFWYVAKWSLTRPVADIPAMAKYAARARHTFVESPHDPRRPNCVSTGIAALIPNDLPPRDLLNAPDDITTCRTLLLMRGDMQYGALHNRAEVEGFARGTAQDNAELWSRP